MAINSFLGIVYLGYAKTTLTNIIVLLSAFLFTFVLSIALQKHRFSTEAKVDSFTWIQKELFKEIKTMNIKAVRKIKLKQSVCIRMK